MVACQSKKGAQEESLALHSQRGSVRLSGWEQNIPALGTPLLILLNGSSEGHYCSNELFSIILLEESKTCPYDSLSRLPSLKFSREFRSIPRLLHQKLPSSFCVSPHLLSLHVTSRFSGGKLKNPQISKKIFSNCSMQCNAVSKVTQKSCRTRDNHVSDQLFCAKFSFF